MPIKQLRTPNAELTRYASQERCVARAETMRSAFFQINNLRRTHRATPKAAFSTNFSPLAPGSGLRTTNASANGTTTNDERYSH
jgi:hypothetical protein